MPYDYSFSKLPPFTLLDEPQLSFSPDRLEERDLHPLRGLVNFGPYSKTVFSPYTPNLRIATIGPVDGVAKVGNLMRMLRECHKPSDRKEYVPEYQGFESIFRVPLVAASSAAHIKWPSDIMKLGDQGEPELRFMTGLKSAMERLSLIRDQFDVVVVHLPDAWSHVLRNENFDGHDALKALGAYLSIPTQVVNDRTFSFGYKASLAWRLGIALYVKAGGIPWKLAPMQSVPEDTAYIGLAYALRGKGDDSHYVTCCSQVFDMDGGGMQFVAFEARDPISDIDEARKNPFLSRDDMRAVLARSLHLYQTRNAGVLPRRLVIHKTTKFTEGELEGALDALGGVQEIECLEIGNSAAWRGVWLVGSENKTAPSKPSGYPVPRGVLQIRTGDSALLWAAGNAPQASTTGNYFQGKKSIPKPLYLKRYAGSCPLEVSALEAMALTKMDWNNDALYDPVPVTIRYSQKLARTIANVPELPGNTYPYRLFM